MNRKANFWDACQKPLGAVFCFLSYACFNFFFFVYRIVRFWAKILLRFFWREWVEFFSLFCIEWHKFVTRFQKNDRQKTLNRWKNVCLTIKLLPGRRTNAKIFFVFREKCMQTIKQKGNSHRQSTKSTLNIILLRFHLWLVLTAH